MKWNHVFLYYIVMSSCSTSAEGLCYMPTYNYKSADGNHTMGLRSSMFVEPLVGLFHTHGGSAFLGLTRVSPAHQGICISFTTHAHFKKGVSRTHDELVLSECYLKAAGQSWR